MKKIILPVILSLFVGGFVNAQTTAKQSSKPVVKAASSVSTTHTPAVKSTVSKTNTQKATPATPATPAIPAKRSTTIWRKHKHAPKKTKK